MKFLIYTNERNMKKWLQRRRRESIFYKIHSELKGRNLYARKTRVYRSSLILKQKILKKLFLHSRHRNHRGSSTRPTKPTILAH